MTPDFREGLIAGLERSVELIDGSLKHGDLTPEQADPLRMLGYLVSLEIKVAERAEADS